MDLDILGSGAPLLIALGCIVLCIVGVILFIGMQIIGGVFGIFGGVVDVVFELATAGPVPGCGCVVVVVGCMLCVGVVLAISSVLSTCGTPDAVNFCRIFG